MWNLVSFDLMITVWCTMKIYGIFRPENLPVMTACILLLINIKWINNSKILCCFWLGWGLMIIFNKVSYFSQTLGINLREKKITLKKYFQVNLRRRKKDGMTPLMAVTNILQSNSFTIPPFTHTTNPPSLPAFSLHRWRSSWTTTEGEGGRERTRGNKRRREGDRC